MDSGCRAPRPPRGFIPSLVMELNIALMFIAIVLAFLIPRVFDGKARAKDRAAFVPVLARLVEAQDRYRTDHGRYADSLGALGLEERGRGPRLVRADSGGWSATIESRHLFRPRVTCGVYDGRPDYAPHRAVTRPREPACWGVWLWVKRTRE